ncbi:hypothetical protein [Paraburkholderia susongensis]|uniref:hypothetical protein n=1 Tax=Paraburkholderia susongensis TaxID=1515439 RepID=UPI001180581F|nr:hypothetical protein [Paraburkholderia susongensis]
MSFFFMASGQGYLAKQRIGLWMKYAEHVGLVNPLRGQENHQLSRSEFLNSLPAEETDNIAASAIAAAVIARIA